MRWINTNEYKELLDWIKENCWFYNMELKWKITKYVECSLDTRDWLIWTIALPEYKFSIRDDENEDWKTIADWIKEFLINNK